MDIATIVGIISGFTLMTMAILNGGEIGMFIDIPSLLIVLGGTISVLLISFPLREVVQVSAIVFYVFGMPRRYMCLVSQKLYVGPDAEVRQHLIQKFPPDEITEDDANEIEARLKLGVAIFDRMKTCPLIIGGISVLICVINMLSNLSDPSAIGPGVATAIISLFYGLVLHLLCIGFRNKLERLLAPVVA